MRLESGFFYKLIHATDTGHVAAMHTRTIVSWRQHPVSAALFLRTHIVNSGYALDCNQNALAATHVAGLTAAVIQMGVMICTPEM